MQRLRKENKNYDLQSHYKPGIEKKDKWGEDRTRTARAVRKCGTNWVTRSCMEVHARTRLSNLQWRTCKIKLCITRKLLSVNTYYFGHQVRG
jgi:hypothetical protein